eukprot:scaffold120550_cov28-Tisochrysis_lutea.AAC.9
MRRPCGGLCSLLRNSQAAPRAPRARRAEEASSRSGSHATTPSDVWTSGRKGRLSGPERMREAEVAPRIVVRSSREREAEGSAVERRKRRR